MNSRHGTPLFSGSPSDIGLAYHASFTQSKPFQSPMQSPHTPLVHQLLLAGAVMGWVLAIGGLAYAHWFVTSAMGRKSIMSPRTFTQLLVVCVAWLVALLVLVVALGLMFLSGHESRSLTLAAVISGIQLLPIALMFGAAWLK